MLPATSLKCQKLTSHPELWQAVQVLFGAQGCLGEYQFILRWVFFGGSNSISQEHREDPACHDYSMNHEDSSMRFENLIELSPCSLQALTHICISPHNQTDAEEMGQAIGFWDGNLFNCFLPFEPVHICEPVSFFWCGLWRWGNPFGCVGGLIWAPSDGAVYVNDAQMLRPSLHHHVHPSR